MCDKTISEMVWSCTENSVRVTGVYCVYESQDIILAQICTTTNSPSVDMVGDYTVFLSPGKSREHCGLSMVFIDVPSDFMIWSTDVHEKNIRVTMIRQKSM